MKKLYGMTAMGYAIVTVIIVGLVMIISAPMIVDTYKPDTKNKINSAPSAPAQNNPPQYNNDYQIQNISQELRNVEERLNLRISDLEQRQSTVQSTDTTVSDKYVCSIEGTVNENGDVIPLNENNSSKLDTKKIVFVCEYRK